WGVGDSALLLDKTTGRPLPPTADIALRSGETAALALTATLQGRKPERVLRPITRNVISVGRRNGAADLLGVKLKGRLALTIKDLIEWEDRQSIPCLRIFPAARVVYLGAFVPFCRLFASYIKRHPDYAPWVKADYRDLIEGEPGKGKNG